MHQSSTSSDSVHRSDYLYLFFFSLMSPPPPRSTLFPYTTLFRSSLKGICITNPMATPWDNNKQYEITNLFNIRQRAKSRIYSERQSSRFGRFRTSCQFSATFNNFGID